MVDASASDRLSRMAVAIVAHVRELLPALALWRDDLVAALGEVGVCQRLVEGFTAAFRGLKPPWRNSRTVVDSEENDDDIKITLYKLQDDDKDVIGCTEGPRRSGRRLGAIRDGLAVCVVEALALSQASGEASFGVRAGSACTKQVLTDLNWTHELCLHEVLDEEGANFGQLVTCAVCGAYAH
eukprot:6375591-Amphidinium_carterae.1